MVRGSVFSASLAALFFFAGMAFAAETSPPPDPTAKVQPVYVPPNRGAPVSRVGGGTRGAGGDETLVRVLAPEHTGLASRDQPTLYWYVSRAAARLAVVLIDDAAEMPLLELEMVASAPAGIQSLQLAEHGIRLKPNVEYQWSVALVIDPEQRSKDLLASGSIMYVPAPETMQAAVAAAKPEELPSVYAAAGYWYDAIDSISILIGPAAGKSDLIGQRNALLGQVGLAEVASSPAP